eukprot:12063729-Karenia_brevis.AAC.1
MEGLNAGQTLQAWCNAMMRDRVWGDNLALEGMAQVVGHPLVVWRKDSRQEPTVFIPRGYNELDPPYPIYLELDERHQGCEHYNALLLGGAANSVPGGSARRTSVQSRASRSNSTSGRTAEAATHPAERRHAHCDPLSADQCTMSGGDSAQPRRRLRGKHPLGRITLRAPPKEFHSEEPPKEFVPAGTDEQRKAVEEGLRNQQTRAQILKGLG